jgi:hypothetical protein
MTTLARAVEQGRSGLFRIEPGKTEDVTTRARAAGLAVHRVDLSGATTKSELLTAVARALDFPDWFGGNWDALEDSLGDLSWLPEGGLVVLVEGFEGVRTAVPGELDTLLDVLRSAARSWEAEKRTFLVLVADEGAPGLATLR